MHHYERQVSSSRSGSGCNPATRRTLTPVSNFLQTYQTAASAATPSSLSGTRMTLPSLREVCHLVFVLDASSLRVLSSQRVRIWPQISYHLWFTRSIAPPRLSLPFLSNHRFRLFPHTLTYRADPTRRVDPFVSSVWDRSTVQTNLQLPICRFPTSCVQSSQTNSATYTLERRLDALRNQKCRGRPYWTLARPSSTCSGWDGRSSWRQSTSSSSVSLPPAGFLHTDARSHHRSQDSPSRGAVTGHTRSLFTRTDQTQCRRQDIGVKELQ